VKRVTLKTSREAIGYLYILPWLLGFALFFLQPIAQLIQLSFTSFELNAGGMSLLPMEDMWTHYKNALTGDGRFPMYLTGAVTNLLTVPMTVFFSLISGLLLSYTFKGRTIMRVAFFLPLIVSASVITTLIRQNAGEVVMGLSDTGSSLFNTTDLMDTLLESGFPQQIVDLLSRLVTNIADLVWKSTVQTFIFLVALLAVPRSYYEVAQIEGATAWESFWKVTFPVSLPFVLVNTVYTVIDSFSSFDNNVIRYISSAANHSLQYDYAAAMSWIYFLVMTAALGLTFLAFNPFLKKNR
jgi:ABC-type sugar transport system permease subunit